MNAYKIFERDAVATSHYRKNSKKLKAINCLYLIVAARAGYPRAANDEEIATTTAGLNPSGMTKTDLH